MFSSDQHTQSLKELITELKNYFNIRSELLRLDFVSKSTILFAACLLAVVMLLFASIVFLFLSFSIVGALAVWLESESLAFLLVATGHIVLAILIYLLRKRLIERPIARFLGGLFLNSSNNHQQTL